MGITPPVRLVTAALWVLVALGPLLGAAALLHGAPSGPAADRPPPIPVGVAGLAEVAVVAHVRDLPGDVAPALAPAAARLRPAGDVLDGLTTAQQAAAARAMAGAVGQASAVAARAAGASRWGVTVALSRPRGLEQWQVTVAEVDGALVVETLPALVGTPAPPEAIPVPTVSALRPPGDDDVTATTVGFLAAYLAGDGDVGRYTATDAELPAPPAGVQSAELRRIASGPVDDRHLAVLAETRAIREDGAVAVMQYPLLLQHHDARWEVRQLLPALPVRRPIPSTGDESR